MGYDQFDATQRAWPTRWATGNAKDGPDTPGRARCTSSQLTGQDNLNLTKQSIAQQRRCVTPLGTLRPTTSMGATQSPGFTTKGRSLVETTGPEGRASLRAVQRLTHDPRAQN